MAFETWEHDETALAGVIPGARKSFTRGSPNYPEVIRTERCHAALVNPYTVL
jgi:hypothetical protein